MWAQLVVFSMWIAKFKAALTRSFPTFFSRFVNSRGAHLAGKELDASGSKRPCQFCICKIRKSEYRFRLERGVCVPGAPVPRGLQDAALYLPTHSPLDGPVVKPSADGAACSRRMFSPISVSLLIEGVSELRCGGLGQRARCCKRSSLVPGVTSAAAPRAPGLAPSTPEYKPTTETP